MSDRGECLACKHLKDCTRTSLEQVRDSFTCFLFEPIPEPVYQAREKSLKLFGETAGIHVLMGRVLAPPVEEEG